MAINVGSVYVRLGGELDRKGFDDFEKEKVRAQRLKDISTRLGADVDEKQFTLYERKLEEVRAKAARRDAYKVTLGAEYDNRAFRAFEADMTRSRKEIAAAQTEAIRMDRARERSIEAVAAKTIQESQKAAAELERSHAQALRLDQARTQSIQKVGIEMERQHALALKMDKTQAESSDRARQAMGRMQAQAIEMNRRWDESNRKVGVFERLTKSLTSLGGGGGGSGFFGGLLSGLGSITAAGAKAGESLGGSGGGLVGAIAGLGGAAAAGGAALGGLLAIFAALAGGAIALVGSLGAAAAGLGALGIGAAAALGPLAALAGAVVQRFGLITDAYKALDTQQSKGAQQAQGVAQAQQAAAQRIQTAQRGVITAHENVQKAEDNLTAARFKARREVENLATAVTRAALAEQSASLSLASAQERLTKVNLDPNATLLDRLDAQQGVTQAVQGTTDAHTAYQRALQDRAKGTDLVRVAQQRLDDAVRAEKTAEQQVTQARQAATVATQKQGAAATDAQQKLAELTGTERHLLTTMQGFVTALQAMFQPATDAIFHGVDGALKSLEPVLGRFTGRFKGLGTALGSIIDGAAKSLAGPEWQRALDSFIATSQKIVKPISDTIGSVLVILRNIAVAAQPLVVEFANWMAKALGGLADKTKDAGRMRDIIRSLVDHTRSWAELTLSVSRVLFTIFSSGAKDGKSFVDWLRQIVDHWNAFLNTTEGQQRLHDFFRNAIDLSKRVFAALGQVVGALVKISAFFLNLATHLAPAGKFIKDHTALVMAAVTAWGALKVAILAANAASVLGGLRAKAAPAAAGAAAPAAGLGLGPTVVGAGVIAGLVVLENVLKTMAKHGNDVAGGMDLAAKAAKQMAAAGDVAGIRRLAASIDDWGKSTGATRDQINKLKGALGDLADGAENDLKRRFGKTVQQVSHDTQSTFDLMFRETRGSMSDIARAVATNTALIKQRLGKDTADGRAALAENFRQAAAAVKQSMADGTISTKTGTAEIRRLMVQALKSLGLTNSQAVALQDHGTLQSSSSRVPGQGLAPNAKGGFIRRAIGGWIGSRGMVSDDIVQIAPDAVAAFGEYDAHGPGGRRAIINRHQAPAVEWALAAGGYPSLDALPSGGQLPAIEQAMGPMGGLDALFANITRPHYLADGGYVQGAVPAGGPAAAALAREMFARGFNVTSAKRNTTSYHGSAGDGLGDALDFGNSVNDLRKVWSVLFPRRASFVELFGPSAFAGLYHGTQKFTDPALQAGHEDHVHVAIVNKLMGALASAVPRIRSPKVRGTGSVAGMVRRALTLTTRGANSQIARAASSQGAVLGGDTLSVGPAVGGNSRAVVEAGLRLAGIAPTSANVGRMLTLLGKENASGDPAATNPIAVGSEHATGFLQMLPSTFRSYAVAGHTNIRNAVDNAAASARYQVARYGHLVTQSPYARGGMLKRLASGGWAGGSLNTGWGASNIRPTGSTGGSGGSSGVPGVVTLQKTRIAAYDNLDSQIADLGTKYTQADRRYSLTDEILIDPTTGEINVEAINQRVGEIDGLLAIRQKILDLRRKMRAIALRVIHTYQTLIKRLTTQLAHMKKGPRRDKAIGELSAYQGGLTDYQGKLHDLEVQYIPDALLDVQELGKERAGVLGTTADATAADTGAATDTGTASADTTATAPTPADIAAAAMQDFQNYLSGAQDLYRNFGNNFISAGQAGGMFANPDLATSVAGLRYFGAASGGRLGGAMAPTGSVILVQDGASVVSTNYPVAPGDDHTWANQTRYQIEGAVG